MSKPLDREGFVEKWRWLHPTAYSAVEFTDDLDAMLAAERERCAEVVPTNWLHSFMTGPDRVIGKPPYNGHDLERLCKAIAAAIRAGKEGGG